jgi:hypothetical protein
MEHGLGEIKPQRPHPEMPANLESASQKARRTTAEYALKPESFIHPDGASKEMVERDLAYVESRKAHFEGTDSQEYKLAKSFEAALFERVNNNRWFGNRVKMIMPSEYDDFANGMDGVLEFHEDSGSQNYLGLGIDVSYSQNPDGKFEIIKEQIEEARLGTVKYFRNTEDTFEGRLKNLPRAVVMLNAADATRVVRDWDQEAADTDSIYRKAILRQLEIQLEAYQAYARKLEREDKKRFVTSRFFSRAKESVSSLLKEITKPEEMTELDKHPSVKMIVSQLEQIGFLEPKLATKI